MFLDARRVPKTEFQVLLPFSASPRELTDRQMHHNPHVFCSEEKYSRTTSCYNVASKRTPITAALIRKCCFQCPDLSLAVIMLSGPDKDLALPSGPQKEGCSFFFSTHVEKMLMLSSSTLDIHSCISYVSQMTPPRISFL